jgi:hypothetical protein
MSQAATIGHNRAPSAIIDTDDAIAATRLIAADLMPRQAELLAGYERWAVNTGGIIGDDVTQGKSADFFKQIAGHIKAVEEARKSAKEPVLSLGKAVDGVFALVADPLVPARAGIERAMTAYAQRKADEERARLRLVAEAAAQRQREADDLARAEAEMLGEDTPPEAPVVPVQAALPTAAEASRVTGDYGSVASLRSRWIHEVTDLASVPREYLMVNDAAIKAAIKGGVRTIPGVRVFQESKVGVR